MPLRESIPNPSQPRKPKHFKEALELTGQNQAGGMKIVPGEEWAMRYPLNAAQRNQTLEGILSGSIDPRQVNPDHLKPTGLIYNENDIDDHGIEGVKARIDEIRETAKHYDYPGLIDFCSQLKGKQVSPELAQNVFDGIQGCRLRKQIFNASFSADRASINRSLVLEAANIGKQFPHLSGLNKILEALKLNWMASDMNIIPPSQVQQAESQLSPDEQSIYDSLKDTFTDYIKNGDKGHKQKLFDKIEDTLPQIQEQQQQVSPQENWSSDEQNLQDQLEDTMKQMEETGSPGLPGSENDLNIPPEDQDEYAPPPLDQQPQPSPTSGAEKQKPSVLYEITSLGNHPPITGDFCRGRKSYFDAATKTWSKKANHQHYTKSVAGGKRYQLRGRAGKDRFLPLPLPNGYAFDAPTLKLNGVNQTGSQTQAWIHRDQNGCFYLKTQPGITAEYTIEFQQEIPPHIGPPRAEDTQRLSVKPLTPPTESIITSTTGTKRQKAIQLRDFIHRNHRYPGGGDLTEATALQDRLRHGSTAENYLPNLDASKYLECYSANTLFADIARRAGIPTRLVIGDHIDTPRGGKVQITDSTGHAWSEIWDDLTREWVRIDATPPPDPNDKKKKDKADQQKQKDEEPPTPGEQAKDGGEESPEPQDQNQQQGQKKQQGQKQPQGQPQPQDQNQPQDQSPEQSSDDLTDAMKERQDKLQDQMEQNQPGKEIKEASEDDFEQGEKALEQLENEKQRMKERKKEIEDQIDQAESFNQLEDIKDQLESEDLLEEQKKQLQDQIESQENRKKEELEKQLQKMDDDGFIDKETKDDLERQMKEGDMRDLDEVQRRLEQESHLHREYEAIKAEVMPMVDKYFRYFANRLPKEEQIDLDEDSLSRAGSFNRKAVQKTRNLIMGTVKNPRKETPDIKPRFIAQITVDVSGSMEGEKLSMARKMLVFYCELFTKISREFGYIHFAIHTFSERIKVIKSFKQRYDSNIRYAFESGINQTIKARLMKGVTASGGTDIDLAVRAASKELEEMKRGFRDYASALYFMGDGEGGDATQIRKFMDGQDPDTGFGKHMRSACVFGSERDRQVLAPIFGEENTTVGNTFEKLVNGQMAQFGRDIDRYTKGKMKKS